MEVLSTDICQHHKKRNKIARYYVLLDEEHATTCKVVLPTLPPQNIYPECDQASVSN